MEFIGKIESEVGYLLKTNAVVEMEAQKLINSAKLSVKPTVVSFQTLLEGRLTL